MRIKTKARTKNETALLRNSVIAYTRNELNRDLEDRLGIEIKVTQEMWDVVADSIHNNDTAWSYMNDAIDNAVLTILKNRKESICQK